MSNGYIGFVVFVVLFVLGVILNDHLHKLSRGQLANPPSCLCPPSDLWRVEPLKRGVDIDPESKV
jgi:hypothetical protein